MEDWGHVGGKAIVKTVVPSISGGAPTINIGFEDINSIYNWQFLEEKQEKLASEYGEQIAELYGVREERLKRESKLSKFK